MRHLLSMMTVMALSAPVILGSASAAPDTTPLSLGDRRGVQTYQTGPYPGLLKGIQDAAGFEVPVQVQWEAIAVRGQGDHYTDPQFWTDIFFVPLTDALKRVAADDMGKQALKTGLKSIVVTYDKDTAPASAYENGVTFSSGVLTLNFTPYTNAHDTADRTTAIVKLLESKL